MAFTFAFGAKVHWHLYIQSGFERKSAHAILLLLKGLQYLCCQVGSVPYVLWQMAIVHPQQIFLVFVQASDVQSINNKTVRRQRY